MGFWLLPRDKENEASKCCYERLTNEKTNEEIVKKGNTYFISFFTRGSEDLQFYEITEDAYNKLKEKWDSKDITSRGVIWVI